MLPEEFKDFKWSLIYTGKDKTYKVTEHRRVDGDWVQIGSTSWHTINAALDHIELSNERRLKGVSP